jgi:3,4-dihydroxy-9,10-secoandrosta-1,3,5(10)-triene-9,17-dione 4,5-dioxygenase
MTSVTPRPSPRHWHPDLDGNRETNHRIVSLYSRSPAGFDVEFGFGGLLVDESTWTVKQITKPRLWGDCGPAA